MFLLNLPIELIIIYFTFYIFISWLYVEVSGPYYLEKKYDRIKFSIYCENLVGKKPKLDLSELYYEISLYIILPFILITRKNKYYLIRLFGYVLNFIYAPIAFMLHIILMLVSTVVATLKSVFQKNKKLD